MFEEIGSFGKVLYYFLSQRYFLCKASITAEMQLVGLCPYPGANTDYNGEIGPHCSVY